MRDDETPGKSETDAYSIRKTRYETPPSVRAATPGHAETGVTEAEPQQTPEGKSLAQGERQSHPPSEKDRESTQRPEKPITLTQPGSTERPSRELVGGRPQDGRYVEEEREREVAGRRIGGDEEQIMRADKRHAADPRKRLMRTKDRRRDTIGEPSTPTASRREDSREL
ncbi:unnamed protein product [Arctogadus glacialis]